MSKKRFTLIDNDNKKEYQLDGMKGSIGPDVINISSLYKDTGLFTYDPGFTSTAACNSKITYIDGEKGVLLYRGYPIEQLANNSSFLEVSYLLMHGELPSQPDKIEFENTIKNHTLLNEQITHFFRGFRRDAHPMAMMIGVVGALSAFYHDSLNIEDPEHRMISSHRMLAKMPTIAAMAFKYHLGEPFMYPLDKYDYTDNFLHMSFATPTKQYEINPLFSKIMDQIFILHADHEQNASTSTVRTAGSSLANPYACISAGISSLWGKSHGGANEAVIDMIQEIKDNHVELDKFLIDLSSGVATWSPQELTSTREGWEQPAAGGWLGASAWNPKLTAAQQSQHPLPKCSTTMGSNNTYTTEFTLTDAQAACGLLDITISMHALSIASVLVNGVDLLTPSLTSALSPTSPSAPPPPTAAGAVSAGSAEVRRSCCERTGAATGWLCLRLAASTAVRRGGGC